MPLFDKILILRLVFFFNGILENSLVFVFFLNADVKCCNSNIKFNPN